MSFLLDIMPPCLVHHFTGLYCPGCGGTRAFIALIHGQFLKTAYYHPLVLYVAVCFGWYFLKKAIEVLSGGQLIIAMPETTLLVNIAAGIVIINCLLRNILYFGWGIAIY